MSISKNSILAYSVSFVILVICCFVYFSAPGAAAGNFVGGTTITTIASGLHNPRGLNFGPDGGLYVAEAAADGPHDLTQSAVMGDNQRKCAASTGSIARIDLDSGEVERIISSLPSLISPDPAPTATPLPNNGNGGAGAHDVSFNGMGNAYVAMGLGGNPAVRSALGPNGPFYARLARFNPSGKFRYYEDLGAYEADENPDGEAPDSNPYGLLALPGRVIYADAGGNTLNQVTSKGEITTLAVFPRRTIPRPGGTTAFVQAVPTSVALGPDGDYYVGQLTGFPFTVGVAWVWRVPAEGGTPVVAHTGFTNIIDIAFGPDGSLYVLEIARNAIPNFGAGGKLVRIEPDGTRTNIIDGPPLIAPGGIAVGRDGALYVTNLSTSSTLGQVLRIEL